MSHRSQSFRNLMRGLASSWCLGLLALSGLVGSVQAQPTQVSYQGELKKDGTLFTGSAQMKFALVNGGAAFWSNDGTSATGEEPDTSVPVTVDQGIFSVLLGGTGMVPLTANAIAGLSSASLRVWVNTGAGFELLPDQALASAAFALHSESAERSFSGFTANGVIESTSGGFKFPDGTLQTTAATSTGGGGTLDQAYDFGGPGAGRTITADAGAVQVNGTDGLRVNGSIGVGANTIAPTAKISVKNVGGNDTTKLLSFDEATGDEFYLESGFAGASDTGNFLKLNTAWTSSAMVWRGDGHVGLGTNSPGARLQVLHVGSGTASPALNAANLASDGIAITATNVSTQPTMVVTQAGSGDILTLNPPGGGSPPTRVDNQGRLRLAANFGGGVSGAPIYSENVASNGVAVWAKASGTDGTLILEQAGTGSLIRGFKSGSLKFEVQNSGRVVTTALQITGGGDLAEPFHIRDDARVEPGSVLVIDARHEGRLKISDRAYDACVAGVASGAGGIEPGITLIPGDKQIGGREVALSGRVYVLADASTGAIAPGDLLTTSDVAGHAMKATDPRRRQGAILGKAMSGLAEGRGLVLALVTLQ